MTDPAQLLRAARTAIQQQDYPAAVQAMQSLVQHDQKTGNTTLEILHRSNLALLQNRLGMSEEALAHLEQSLQLARQAGDRASEDGVLGNMGAILQELGQTEKAIEHLQAAITIADEIGDKRGRGNWLSALGLAHDDLGRFKEAAGYHKQSITIARQLNDQKGLAGRLGQLGNTQMRQGQVQSALANYQEAVEIYRQLGDAPALALRLGIIGNIYAELGRAVSNPDNKETYLVQALANYRETLKIARDLGDQVSEAALLRGMGNVYGNLEDYDRAIEQFQAAAALFQQVGLPEQADTLQENIALARQLRDATDD